MGDLAITNRPDVVRDKRHDGKGLAIECRELYLVPGPFLMYQYHGTNVTGS